MWSLISGPPNVNLRASLLFLLLGIPFVVMGQYLMWGRYLYKKRRTHYAVTNRRVIVVQNLDDRQVASAEIATLPALIKEMRSGEVGTLWFAPAPDLSSMTMSERRALYGGQDVLSMARGPVFVDIEDVDSVSQLIAGLRAKNSEAEVAEILRHRLSSSQS